MPYIICEQRVVLRELQRYIDDNRSYGLNLVSAYDEMWSHLLNVQLTSET